MADTKKAAALAAFESVGSAAVLGYVHGRQGKMPEKYKVPLDAAVGVAGVLAGVFGTGNKYLKMAAPHLLAVGVGALSYFGGSLGGQFGQKARFKAGEMKSPYPGPYLTGNENDPNKDWRDARTITAGAPVAGPVGAGQYARAWR